MIKGVIFDFDGTLVDSTWIWYELVDSIIREKGIWYDKNWLKGTEHMEPEEVVCHIRNKFHIEESAESILGQLENGSGSKYELVGLKPFVREFLDFLQRQGMKMCIASATDREKVKEVAERLDILKYMTGVLSCRDVGATKAFADIYHAAREALGTMTEETVVIEDMLFAVRTAKAAGFPVIGIYDEVSAGDRVEIEALSDLYVDNYKELLDNKEWTRFILSK